jgi:hypothetical protein
MTETGSRPPLVHRTKTSRCAPLCQDTLRAAGTLDRDLLSKRQQIVRHQTRASGVSFDVNDGEVFFIIGAFGGGEKAC